MSGTVGDDATAAATAAAATGEESVPEPAEAAATVDGSGGNDNGASKFDLLVGSVRDMDPKCAPLPAAATAGADAGGNGGRAAGGGEERTAGAERLAAARQRQQERQDRKMTKTTSASLQAHLDRWSAAVQAAVRLPSGSAERIAAARAFSLSFVPPDVSQEDALYYADGLADDHERFVALAMELRQCASGARVFMVAGDDRAGRVVFSLHPLGKLAQTEGIDIDRELAFVSADSGKTWRAEG